MSACDTNADYRKLQIQNWKEYPLKKSGNHLFLNTQVDRFGPTEVCVICLDSRSARVAA